MGSPGKRKANQLLDEKSPKKNAVTSAIERASPWWTPSRHVIESSNWTRFTAFVNKKHSLELSTPHQLWQWSVDNLEQFWQATWEFTQMIASVPAQQVLDDKAKLPGAKFFVGARLNFAENLLRFRDDSPAILFHAETSNKHITISFAQLYDRVLKVATSLKKLGVTQGDRVVGYLPNIPEAIIAMLAATSLGAIWSGCATDFGAQAVLDRLAQVQPKVLFAADGHFYKGQRIDTLSQLKEIVDKLPTLEKVVVVRYTIHPDHDLDLSRVRNATYYDTLLAIPPDETASFEFVQLPFDHPVFIMFSSGTTGLPKCLVQGPGVLLNHLKELLLHMNVSRGDRVFYYTTTGWMMWNWLVSALGIGATVVLMDGNPLYPSAGALWKLAASARVTLFGTSARYLAAVMDAKYSPAKEDDLSHLRVIASTGSPASSNIFKFVYEEIKQDVQFASISGGTDLNGCFALGCSNLPVYDGELQIRGLGLDVGVFDDDGQGILQAKGELVCRAPFPSMPLYFWDDPNGVKYHGAYFDVFPGIWRHGDFAEVTQHGGLIIYGRSDATLNPGGVRIGTADIYKIMEQIEEVEDSLVVGQNYVLDDGTPDVRIVLFVIMRANAQLTPAFEKRMRAFIRQKLSPRHVPALIASCPAIPYTVSGKKVELAVKKLIDGQTVNNKSALQNPESLDWFETFAPTISLKQQP